MCPRPTAGIVTKGGDGLVAWGLLPGTLPLRGEGVRGQGRGSNACHLDCTQRSHSGMASTWLACATRR
jgi:hypothetical protein